MYMLIKQSSRTIGNKSRTTGVGGGLPRCEKQNVLVQLCPTNVCLFERFGNDKMTEVSSVKSKKNMKSSTLFRTSRMFQTLYKHGGRQKKEKSEAKWRHSSAEIFWSSFCTRPKRRLMTSEVLGGDAVISYHKRSSSSSRTETYISQN